MNCVIIVLGNGLLLVQCQSHYHNKNAHLASMISGINKIHWNWIKLKKICKKMHLKMLFTKITAILSQPKIVNNYTYHWGWTHEGVCRHPRQDGGGLFHRLGKLQANLQSWHICWRPILLEIIVTDTRNAEAEFQVVIGGHSAVIPTWKVAWWRGWCTFQFSRCRGWLSSMSRVTPRWTRVTHA